VHLESQMSSHPPAETGTNLTTASISPVQLTRPAARRSVNIVRLNTHELGLLPDRHRKKFIATVSNYALAGDDLYALEDLGIRSVLEAHEFDELLLRVRSDLLPRLGDIRRDWQSNLSL
jgi:hypothetical protein